MHAVRNIRLCTKDCICLFVCPTGATNTESGQIDVAKCLDDCRRCVDACPSHALSLVMDNYPQPASKNTEVAKSLLALLDRKAAEEAAVARMAAGVASQGAALLAKALAASLRILAEDAAREADFLLPQSKAVRALIQDILAQRPSVGEKPFPEEELKELLTLLSR